MLARLRRWWRPERYLVEAFRADHPHLEEADAHRVLAHVAGAVHRDMCERSVAAVAMEIRVAFPGWFYDDLDAARHAGRVLGLALAEAAEHDPRERG